MNPVRFVDSHVHFWDPEHLHYEWLQNNPSLNRRFLPDDLLKEGDELTPERIVFVEADCAKGEGLAEVEWVQELAAAESRIQGIVAFAGLEQGEHLRPYLENLSAYSMVKGVRRLIQAEAPGFCVQPDFVQGVQLLSEYGLSFDICIVHHQMQDAIELVRQCPNVSFVLDHIGKPNIRDAQLEPWAREVAALAAFENVVCKLSGLVTEADHENWRPEHLQPYVDHVLDVFGPSRLMFSGDWPVSKLASDYHEWAATAMDAVSELSLDERQKIFNDNATRFYRLEES